MRIIITITLMLLGFIFGVVYDQNIAVLPLMKEAHAIREEKEILERALGLCAKNKFQKGDYVWWAIQLERRGE